jgi:hypothetical protein
LFSGGAAWNGAAWVAKHTQAGIIGTLAGSLQFYSDAGLTTGNSYTPTLRMTVSSTGNVGIGDGTPAALLSVGNGDLFQVNGSGDITTAAAESLNINTGTTGAISIDTGTTGSVSIATGANAKAVTVGNTTGTTSVTINTGTGTAGGDLNLADTAVAGKRVDIGSVTNSATTSVNIATDAGAAQTIQVGGTGLTGGSNAGTTVALQGGAIALNITDAGATLQSFTNSATTLRILTSGSTPVLVADTANSTPRILIGNPTSALTTAALVVTTQEVTTRLLIGTVTNGVDINVAAAAGQQFRLSGNARNSKSITLSPE